MWLRPTAQPLFSEAVHAYSQSMVIFNGKLTNYRLVETCFSLKEKLKEIHSSTLSWVYSGGSCNPIPEVLNRQYANPMAVVHTKAVSTNGWRLHTHLTLAHDSPEQVDGAA